jgi:hypothetical protein
MATIRQKLSTYAITISTFQQHRHFQRDAHAELGPPRALFTIHFSLFTA